MWCIKPISSSFLPGGCGHGCMMYFFSCAFQSADMNKHCHLCISAASMVCRLFSEGGAYWQNKLCLGIVMLSWSLKVWVIFKSNNLQTRILANWSWAQAQAGVTAAAKKHQKIHDQPVPFSSFMTCAPAPKWWGCWTAPFEVLATHSVKETEPWLFLKENYLSRACSFYWNSKEKEKEPRSLNQFLFSSLSSRQKALCMVTSMFSTAFVICCHMSMEWT